MTQVWTSKKVRLRTLCITKAQAAGIGIRKHRLSSIFTHVAVPTIAPVSIPQTQSIAKYFRHFTTERNHSIQIFHIFVGLKQGEYDSKH
jgi:hypothetical protein